jgi:hypothetical protein
MGYIKNHNQVLDERPGFLVLTLALRECCALAKQGKTP